MPKTKNKYGTIRIIARWFNLLPQIIDSWRIFICYAFVMTMFSVILNRWTYTCKNADDGYWCGWYNNIPYMPILTFILCTIATLYLLSSFACDFYQGMQGNTTYKIADIFKVNKTKLKSVGVFFGCLALILVPCAIAIYIINPMQFSSWHTVNDDWRIEFVYFIIAFFNMMLPLLFMRCSGGIGYYFNEGQIPWQNLYKLTTRRAYAGIFTFMLLLLICLNIHINIMKDLNKLVTDYNCMTMGIVTEFLHNMAILLYFALFLLLFQAQYLQLKAKEEDQNQTAIINDLASDDKKIFNKTTKARDLSPQKQQIKKSAKKKKSQRKAKTKTNIQKENKK